MKIRTQSGQLVDITGKVTTTVRLPDGSFQILLHTKDKKEGDILGGYSTEAKAVHVLCGIQVAVRHPEKIRIFVMPAQFPESSNYFGVMVAIPYWAEATDEFENPTPIDGTTERWKLAVALSCREGPRRRSMTELLFCMLRSGH